MRPSATILAVLLAALALGTAYIAVIPPWQSPDEPTHFEYARILADGAGPWDPSPSPDLQREIVFSLDRHGYWRHVGVEPPSPLPGSFRDAPFLSAAPSQIGKNPPLYYWLASLVLKSSPASTLEGGVFRLRALSLFFSLLTIAVVWLCAREVFGAASPLCPAAAAAAAFLPQFMVIGTSVSPDPLINLFGAGAIWLAIRFQRTGWTFPRLLLLALWQGAGLLAGYKLLIVWAALGGGLLLGPFFAGNGIFPIRRFFILSSLAAAFLLTAYSVLAWHFPPVTRVFVVRLNLLADTIVNFCSGRTNFPEGYWSWFNRELFRSFWLKYGWLRYELPAAYYSGFMVATLGALVGLTLFLAGRPRRNPGPASRGRAAAFSLMVYAVVALGGYYLFWGLKPEATSTQGRHLFLVMPAWAILFVLGWRQLLPARGEWVLAATVTLVFLALNLVSLFGYILPTFS